VPLFLFLFLVLVLVRADEAPVGATGAVATVM
jgi:hypothetical protein